MNNQKHFLDIFQNSLNIGRTTTDIKIILIEKRANYNYQQGCQTGNALQRLGKGGHFTIFL